jgi:hypothetical protein
VFGFRYDENRDAHVLRLVGNRFGPVLRNRPPIDSVAAQMEWSESMVEQAERRPSGRFARERQRAADAQRDLLKR